MLHGNSMFTIIPIFIGIIFILVFGFILFSIIQNIVQWKKNEASPRLSVPAIVKVKRTNTSNSTHHHGETGAHHHTSSSTYFVTFEFESGDRSEFRITGKEFGLLADGDIGTLTFQGTRYVSFERQKTVIDINHNL
ncbi:DUF2500 domain-containing protein [Caldibacillus lycopersici]|uniref:DUF2500 domain-containing protein n=2 Tax=Perspicuibacillus lycopersici TaxID=1325689 RepID=A0AAE3IY24_9BACI|nr:DUF2500 domain-containing protein [Perspicuibacillus lycopersici]